MLGHGPEAGGAAAAGVDGTAAATATEGSGGTTAPAGFSRMALIKTKPRNCLNIVTLNALMMVSLNGPPIDSKEFQSLLDRA